MRSALGKARGKGSARGGTHHWMMQRITAIGLIPLTIYLIIALVRAMTLDYGGALEWFKFPINGAAMILFITAAFYHANLGMQIIIEDYVPSEIKRISIIIAIKLVFCAAAALSIFSILAVAL